MEFGSLLFERDDDNYEESFELEGAEENRRSPPEKHLSSPIAVSLLQRLLDIFNHCKTNFTDFGLYGNYRLPYCMSVLENYLREHPTVSYSSITNPMREFMRVYYKEECMPKILDPSEYPLLYKKHISGRLDVETVLAEAESIFELEVNAYCDWIKDVVKPNELKTYKNKLMSRKGNAQWVRDSFNRVAIWDKVVENYRSKSQLEYIPRAKRVGNMKIHNCTGYVWIMIPELDTKSKWRIATYEQLQMVQDVVLARHNIELAFAMKFHNGTHKLREHVTKILLWQEECLTQYGNDGFELVKGPESMFKTWLNTLSKGDVLIYTSYERTRDKLREKERKLSNSDTPLTEKLDRIISEVDNIWDAAELFGLAKLSGHPVVYADKSADSVRSHATSKGTLNPIAIVRYTRMFKHLVLSAYIAKHSDWPLFIQEPALNTILRRHWVNRVTSLPMNSYPMADLDAIVFGKFMEFNYCDDYLDFLDDKAINPSTKEAGKFWFGGNRTSPRRLLEHVLDAPTVDTRALVKKYSSGNFDKTDYLVELTQKERELKREARCFAKLTFNVRLFMIITEINCKSFMADYLPQQTMTMSNAEEKKRLYSLVFDAVNRDKIRLEVDFSRWNLRWRKETVHPISRILENIFNMPGTFSQAHPFFTKATIVLTDKHSLPEYADPTKPISEWAPSSLLWRGTHVGGFEGLQQSLWTICTIAMMYFVFYDQHATFLMAGQGDNQVCTITFDLAYGTLDAQLTKLLAVMEVRCALLNHEVKPEECIDSTTVLTYGKEVYVNGVHIPYNLKFASRSFKQESLVIPSLSKEIAGIMSCAMACADSCLDTFLACRWKDTQLVQALRMRMISPLRKDEKPVLKRFFDKRKRLQFLALLPGSLGGMPILPWTRFFMKGETDDLSWDVASIISLEQHHNTLLNDLMLLSRGWYSPKKPNPKQLIIDPHSIPINRVKDQSQLIREAVAIAIPARTKNPSLLQIMGIANAASGETMKDLLANSTPFYPDIMADFYSWTPAGLRERILGRFTMTRTISSLTGSLKFDREINEANVKQLTDIGSRFDLAKTKNLQLNPRSPFAMCQALRDLWGNGLRNADIGVYTPFEFKLGFFDSQQPMISCSSKGDGRDIISDVGPYAPNFGTATRQKVSDHGYKIVDASSTLRDLKGLTKLVTELGSDQTLRILASDISLSRSPWTISQLSTILPVVYGGSAAHRHERLQQSAFAVLGSKTTPTHLNFCSDLSGKLVGGKDDYPIAFQSFYLSLTNLTQQFALNNLIHNGSSFGMILKDNYHTISASPVKLTPPAIPLKWAVLPGNPLAYVDKIWVSTIPHEPPPNLIPHRQPLQCSAVSMIYSSLLMQYATKFRMLMQRSLVSFAIDLFDLKEFSCIPLRDIIYGCSWFCVGITMLSSVRAYGTTGAYSIEESFSQVCRSIAGLLTRLLVHPDSRNLEYCRRNGIVLRPGIAGARAAEDSMMIQLVETSRLLLNAGSVGNNIPTLILFQDFGKQSRLLGEIHSLVLLAMQGTNKDNKFSLSTRHLYMISSVRADMIHNSTPSLDMLTYAACVRLIRETSRGAAAKVGVFKAVYMRTSYKEALRAWRSKPPEVRLKSKTKDLPLNYSYNPARKTQHVEYSVDALEGTNPPNCNCSDTNRDVIAKNHFLSNLGRPYGRYTGLYSEYIALLSSLTNDIKNKLVLCIGVGHGASASAALTRGAAIVKGIDLRAAMPGLLQREATYVPPEIIECGRSSQFSWHSYVAKTGGDVLNAQKRKELIIEEECSLIIIDIDSTIKEIEPLLFHLIGTAPILVRYRSCDHWLKSFLRACDPDWTVCASFMAYDLQCPTYYSYIPKRRVYALGSSHSGVIIKRKNVFKMPARSDKEDVLNAINDYMAPSGRSLNALTLAELDFKLTEMRRDYHNADSSGRRDTLKRIGTQMNNIRSIVRSPILSNITSRYTNNTIRLGGRWLATTNLTAEDMIQL